MIDTNIITLLSAPDVRKVFDVVAKERNIRLKDLSKTLNLDKVTVTHTLNKLESANLVSEIEAPVEDYKAFLITGDGLATVRKLERLGG